MQKTYSSLTNNIWNSKYILYSLNLMFQNRNTRKKKKKMYVLSFTEGSNAGGGRIKTPLPEVEEKTNL